MRAPPGGASTFTFGDWTAEKEEVQILSAHRASCEADCEGLVVLATCDDCYGGLSCIARNIKRRVGKQAITAQPASRVSLQYTNVAGPTSSQTWMSQTCTACLSHGCLLFVATCWSVVHNPLCDHTSLHYRHRRQLHPLPETGKAQMALKEVSSSRGQACRLRCRSRYFTQSLRLSLCR